MLLAAGTLLQSLPAQLLLHCGGAQLAELLALGLVGSVPVGCLALLAAVADLFAGCALHQLLAGWTGLFAAVRAPQRRGRGGLFISKKSGSLFGQSCF